MGLDRRKANQLNLDDAIEWETKTITSAVKTFFRNLPGTLSLRKFFICVPDRFVVCLVISALPSLADFVRAYIAVKIQNTDEFENLQYSKL